jgi:hypothetical protein
MLKKLATAIIPLIGIILMVLSALINKDPKALEESVPELLMHLGEVIFVISAVHFWYDLTIKKNDKQSFLTELDCKILPLQNLISNLQIVNHFSEQINNLNLIIKDETHKNEINNMIKHLIVIFHRDMKTYDIPPILQLMFVDSVFSKIQKLNTELIEIQNKGNVLISGRDIALKATAHCYDNTNSEVFAISFPSIDFWDSADGKYYLGVSRNSIRRNSSLRIRRYFIIRNEREDIEAIKSRKEEFIEVLTQQIDSKIEVYILHLYERYPRNDRVNTLPDISFYDGKLVSEWVKKEADGDPEQTFISYKGDKLNIAKNVYQKITDSSYPDTQVKSRHDIELRITNILKYAN